MTGDMISIYKLDRKKIAVLQNAFQNRETQKLNNIYTLEFTLPADDPKNTYCQPRYYVRYGSSRHLYRIIGRSDKQSDIGLITYKCEHVITTLVDKVLFGSFISSQYAERTEAVINWLLSQQPTQNWILDRCDFDYAYEYGWEQETILNALYSIPRVFTNEYYWDFDCSTYPWRLKLLRIDQTAKPQYYIRAGRNLLSAEKTEDGAQIATRIYPLGYGEGINQLTIKDVNNGVAYLQADSAAVAKYGIIERVLVDRSFEDAASLKAYAQTVLNAVSKPAYERSFNVVDLYEITNSQIDNAEVGKICKLTEDGTIAYITQTTRQLDVPGDLQIDLSTKAGSVVDTIAGLADRVRIESVYAQGATQLYQHSKDGNATRSKGMVLSLYFPAEMRQINKVLLKLQLEKFRAYSQTTESGGGSQITSLDGGATGTTSTFSATISGSVTSEPSSLKTTESGGLGSDVMTSKTPLEFNTNYYPLSDDTRTGPAGEGKTGDSKISIKSTTDTIDVGTSEATISLSGITSGPMTEGGKTKSETGGSAPNGYTEYSGDHEHSADINISHVHAFNAAGTMTGNPLQYNGYYYNEFNAAYVGVSGGAHSHNIQVNDHAHNMDHHHTFSLGNSKHSHVVNTHKHNIDIAGVGNHNHTLSAHTHRIYKHRHSATIGEHNHSIDKAKFNHTHGMNHTHAVNFSSFGSHSHTFSIAAHSHEINIPAHSHDIVAGIFEKGNPTAFDIYVNGTKKALINAKSWEGDITQWLLNSSKQIPRNSWIKVEIKPNDLAYVISSVFVQGFVQSRGGGNY